MLPFSKANATKTGAGQSEGHIPFFPLIRAGKGWILAFHNVNRQSIKGKFSKKNLLLKVLAKLYCLQHLFIATVNS